jgi:hypothetical protein
MDDTDGRPGHHKTGVMQDTSSASSNLKQNSNENLGPGKSHQRGRRHRNHSQPVNQNNETIETTDPNQLWVTLVDKYCSYWTNPLECERASVTLERYLNDVEEPIHIQSSAESPVSPDRPLCRDTTARGVKISSSGADQKSTKQRLKIQKQTKSNDEPPASKVQGISDTEPNSKTSHQQQRKLVTCRELFSDHLILEPEPIPISLEQLIAECKGLVMVDTNCIDVGDKKASLIKPNSGAELVRIGEHRAASQARLSATTIKSCYDLLAAHSFTICLPAAWSSELMMEEFRKPMTPQLAISLTQAAVRGFTKQDLNSKSLNLEYPEHQSVIASSVSAQTASMRYITPSSWLREHRTINDQSADDAHKQCHDGTTTQSPYQYEVPHSPIIKQIKTLGEIRRWAAIKKSSLTDKLGAQKTALFKGLAFTDREETHAFEWSLVQLDAVGKLVIVERGKSSAKND